MEKQINIKSKRILFSLMGGVCISLVFIMNTHFPPMVSNMPLATVDALPQNAIAIFLDNIRIAFDAGYGIEVSLIALLISTFLYKIYDYLKYNRYVHSKFLMVLSVIFGFINVLSLCMYWLDCLPMFSSPTWMIGTIFLALGWAGIFFIISCLILGLIDKQCLARKQNDCFEIRQIEEHTFVFSFIIILLGWFPWIISYFPASMDNDVFNQLYSWLYVANNHHPWFSTCILGLCYNIGVKVGNENLGIFVYVISRDIILALIYAKCIVLQKEAGCKRIVYYITILFYAITPVWGAYAKHAFKDTFSTGLFCLYIISLVMIIQKIKDNTLTFSLCCLYSISALLASLFRNNCIYAILPATVILFFILIKKRQYIKYSFTILLFLFIYFFYNYAIVNFGNVIPGSKAEILSIPFQQTARTVKIHGSSLTIEERDGINEILQYDELAEVYNPILSDPVKGGAKLDGNHEDRSRINNYLKLWAKMLISHPVTYAEAAIGQSYGYYAFTPNLPEQSGNWNSGMTIFDWIGCNGEFDDNFEFHFIKKLSVFRQILHAWAKVWDKIPLLCLTNICALYTWGIVLLFFYLLSKRMYLRLLPLVAMGVMILTCIASPVNDCFRYYAPIAASSPVLIVLLFESKR